MRRTLCLCYEQHAPLLAAGTAHPGRRPSYSAREARSRDFARSAKRAAGAAWHSVPEQYGIGFTSDGSHHCALMLGGLPRVRQLNGRPHDSVAPLA